MELPPVLQLITSEIPANKQHIDNIRRLLKDKGFLKEISAQAKFSVKRKVSSGAENSITDDSLNISPTTALNPLSNIGKCNSHNCRVIQAESFARSIGLYCDHAVLTDYITPLFLAPDFSSIDPRVVIGNVQALTVLMPMVQAGGRGGSGNSDSVLSGSLASPNPPGGGEPEERGNEENETESRSDV